jgi:hypothetical protein
VEGGGRLITPAHSKGCRFDKNDATDVHGDRTRAGPRRDTASISTFFGDSRAATWRLELAGDAAEGGADSCAHQGKRTDSCDRNQRCDQAVFDAVTPLSFLSNKVTNFILISYRS